MQKNLSIGLLLVAACTFGNSRTIVSNTEVASVLSAATNTNADLLLVGSAAGQLVQVDPATGTVTKTISLWNSTASNAIAIAPAGEDPTQVLTLHADRWVVRWAAGLTMVDWFRLPSFGNTTPCDIDEAQDGDVYASLLDGGNAWIGRRGASSSTWFWQPVAGNACPRIAHDLYHDELYVLQGNGVTLEHRDPDTLAVQSSVVLDADGSRMNDVDVFGGVAVGAGSVPGWVGGVQRMAWHFDANTAAEIDAQSYASGAASSVHITVNDANNTGEMMIGGLGGATTVFGLLLL